MSSPNLIDAVRVVKENEWTASASYADAASKVNDQMAKRLFQMLSEFEKFHYEQLTNLEKSLEASGNFLNSQGKEFPLPPAIETQPSAELAQESIFGIIDAAMNLEKRAEKAYADLAALVSDAQGREIFSRLSEQEHSHYLILRDAYWSLTQQGFRPQ